MGKQEKEKRFSKKIYSDLLTEVNKNGLRDNKTWQRLLYYDDYYPCEATGVTFFKKVIE